MDEEPQALADQRDPTTAQAWLLTTLDLAAIAALVMDAAVPVLADAASVFVLEHLLRNDGREDTSEVVARRLGTRFTGTGKQVTLAAFPPGEVVAFAPDSPYARCVRTGQPVIFDRPDSQTLVRARPGGREVFSQYVSFLAVPVAAGGAVVGFLAFGRTTQMFYDGHAAAAGRLAAGAATGFSNALTLMRQRAIAEALQRGLRVAEPAAPSGLEVAGRCVPADGQVIGGDWYDILALPRGRTGLIVGDVMGHGLAAAGVMAQLRAAAHALAQLDLEPAELLGHLDRTTATLHHATLATCAYAVIDPGSMSCVIATAGHLPPVLTMPDGTTRTPDLPTGQSLGLGTAVYGQARIKLMPGAVIALYTDGLVETRTRSFDQGITVLRSVLAREHGQLYDACDAVIGSLANRYEDDVTLILARIPPNLSPAAGP